MGGAFQKAVDHVSLFNDAAVYSFDMAAVPAQVWHLVDHALRAIFEETMPPITRRDTKAWI